MILCVVLIYALSMVGYSFNFIFFFFFFTEPSAVCFFHLFVKPGYMPFPGCHQGVVLHGPVCRGVWGGLKVPV